MYVDTKKRHDSGQSCPKSCLSGRFSGQLLTESCLKNKTKRQVLKMADILKKKIKELSVRRRTFGETALDRVQAQEIEEALLSVSQLQNILLASEIDEYDDDLEDLDDFERYLLQKYYDIKFAHPAAFDPLPRIQIRHLTIAGLVTLNVDVCLHFRFRDIEQLGRVYQGFRFPPKFTCNGYKFSGEEVFLAGLYRLHRPNVLGDIGWQHLFGWDQPKATRATALFMTFISRNWLYLIVDNMLFWKPHLTAFAEAIRLKLYELGDHNHLPATSVNQGFCIFGFIDNTNLRVCRPGGGPAADGRGAPRNPPLLQRGYYNGWGKRHGYKLQSIHLPNGMAFNIWGVKSLRHNDLEMWNMSHMNERLMQLQADSPLQFKVYGDSAYAVLHDSHIAYCFPSPLTPPQAVSNEHFKSVRETIEWSYAETMSHWKMLDFAHGLRIRQMDVANMWLISHLLNNVYICLNGSNTTEYFSCMPPSFEEYVAQGPRDAHIEV